MYAKYKDFHPEEAFALTVHEWARQDFSALSHDGKTLLELYKLNLAQPLKMFS
jgi:hypothetical protein